MTKVRLKTAIRFRPALITQVSGPSILGFVILVGLSMCQLPISKHWKRLNYAQRRKGIIPALEPCHALAHVAKLRQTCRSDHLMVMNLCGRGDKDIFAVAERFGFDM